MHLLVAVIYSEILFNFRYKAHRRGITLFTNTSIEIVLIGSPVRVHSVLPVPHRRLGPGKGARAKIARSVQTLRKSGLSKALLIQVLPCQLGVLTCVV